MRRCLRVALPPAAAAAAALPHHQARGINISYQPQHKEKPTSKYDAVGFSDHKPTHKWHAGEDPDFKVDEYEEPRRKTVREKLFGDDVPTTSSAFGVKERDKRGGGANKPSISMGEAARRKPHSGFGVPGHAAAKARRSDPKKRGKLNSFVASFTPAPPKSVNPVMGNSSALKDVVGVLVPGSKPALMRKRMEDRYSQMAKGDATMLWVKDNVNGLAAYQFLVDAGLTVALWALFGAGVLAFASFERCYNAVAGAVVGTPEGSTALADSCVWHDDVYLIGTAASVADEQYAFYIPRQLLTPFSEAHCVAIYLLPLQIPFMWFTYPLAARLFATGAGAQRWRVMMQMDRHFATAAAK
jgi:hypothetical protein